MKTKLEGIELKIAYFSDSFYPQINGVVTSILNSSRKLAEIGHKIHIFTIRDKTGAKKIKLHKNIEITYYRSIDAFKYPGFELVIPKTINCLREIRKFGPDIIHIHAPTLLGWEGVICGKLFNIPTVATYHTLIPDFLKHSPIPKIGEYEIAKKMAWKYTNNFHEKCNVTVTPSEAMKRELIKNGLDMPIEVVSNGVNLELFYQRERTNKKFRILHVGRISYEKNIDVVVKAVVEFNENLNKFSVCRNLSKNFQQAKKTNRRDFEFWVVGSGPDLDKIKELVKTLGISEFTKVTGPISNSELPDIYSNSDIFITASTIETEGIVLLEAMACGLPIIGVNARAIPDLIKNSVNGFVVKIGDYKAMSVKLLELYENRNLVKIIKLNNIQEAKKYDVDKCIFKIIEIYKQLIMDKKN